MVVAILEFSMAAVGRNFGCHFEIQYGGTSGAQKNWQQPFLTSREDNCKF